MADTAAAKKKNTNIIDKKALRARLEDKKRRACAEARQRKFAEEMAELNGGLAVLRCERDILAQRIADGARRIAQGEREIADGKREIAEKKAEIERILAQ